VTNHTGSLPALLANVAQLDREAGQLRVGSGRAGPARRELQLEDRRGLGVNRPCCPDTTAGEQTVSAMARQQPGQATLPSRCPPRGRPLQLTTGSNCSLCISTSGSDSSQVPWLAVLMSRTLWSLGRPLYTGRLVVQSFPPMTTLADRLLPDQL